MNGDIQNSTGDGVCPEFCSDMCQCVNSFGISTCLCWYVQEMFQNVDSLVGLLFSTGRCYLSLVPGPQGLGQPGR